MVKSHGEIERYQTYDLIRKVLVKHRHFVGVSFEQGSGQRDFGEFVASTSMVVRTFLCFH
jgi:hypothetical protein